MGNILVVGCASFDTLHCNQDGRIHTFDTIGGAGLYTALAAAKQGATTYLYAPRPEPLPEIFEPVEKLITWDGPRVSINEMPRLEIEHHGNGRATLLGATWAAEDQLTPHSMSAFGDLEFDAIHIAALSSAEKQCQFVSKLKKDRPASLISAGTYAQAIKLDRTAVLSLLDSADLFFMNDNESGLLFDDQQLTVSKSGKIIFVTSGASGASAFTHEDKLDILAILVKELDPTGAGDTFCGAMLAGLTSKLDLKSALKNAAYLSGKVVETPGPEFLLSQG